MYSPTIVVMHQKSRDMAISIHQQAQEGSQKFFLLLPWQCILDVETDIFQYILFSANLFQTSVNRTGLSEVKGKGSEKKGGKVVPLPVNRHIVEFLGIKSTLQPGFIYPSRLAGWRFPLLVHGKHESTFMLGFPLPEGEGMSRPDSDQELPQKSRGPWFVSQSTPWENDQLLGIIHISHHQ